MATRSSFKLGTRASALAITQSETVAQALVKLTGLYVELVKVTTPGDDTSLPFSSIPQPGVFVSSLREALMAGQVDLIVHSYKDLPSAPVAGLTVAAVPLREDARDVLVSRSGRSLQDLPSGAVVGTSSPRRAARVLHLRPDLVVKPIRGNVDSRITKVMQGEYDATVLAAAGLNRLGRLSEATQIFDIDDFIPAPAQGALAVECRSDDTELLSALEQLNDAPSRLLATTERAVLIAVGASCTTAIGALATWVNGNLTVAAELSDETTDEHERVLVEAPIGDATLVSEAHQLGMMAGHKLMQTELGKRLGNVAKN